MSTKHSKAYLTIVAAATLDIVCGLLFARVEHISNGLGLYYAVTTATTVGYGDITPHTTAGHVIAVAIMLTVVPLFAAAFSLFTSGITAGQVHTHIVQQERRLKEHIEERLKHHLGKT